MQRQLDGWQTVFLQKKKNYIYIIFIFLDYFDVII